MVHNYYVYAVECSDGTYYIGVTNDVTTRVEQHNTGVNPKSYTYGRRPVVLKYYAHFHNINQAIAWEKQVKGWSRQKKEAWFAQQWERMKQLSKKK